MLKLCLIYEKQKENEKNAKKKYKFSSYFLYYKIEKENKI